MKISMIARRQLLVAASVFSISTLAFAQTYPAKPIKWVVGFPAGGGTDILARTVGVQLSAQLKQPVIVENRPGAAGMVAAEAVVHSANDGYTLLTGDIAILAFNPSIYQKIRYDPVGDFVPVALTARFPLIIATHPGSGIRSMQQLVSDSKKGAPPISYGSAGMGTPHHMAMELMISTTGITAQHVPYKGDAPALQDVAGGQLPVAVLAPSLSLPYFRSGKLLPLAVTSETRLPQLPDVPTLKELGYASTGVYAWQGLVAPKGTPAPIVNRLSSEVQLALKVPAVQQKLAELGMEATPSDSGAMERYVRSEKAFWAALIKERGIKGD